MVVGCLATGGGLVFTGDAGGFFTAYDADNGKILWNFQCGSGHHASPVTYMLGGRQYIAVCVGWGGWVAGFAGDGAPGLRNERRGNTVFLFALPEEAESRWLPAAPWRDWNRELVPQSITHGTLL